MKTRITIAAGVMLAALMLNACRQAPVTIEKDETDSEPTASARDYEVHSRQDASHKATTKPVTSYTRAELVALPEVKRIIYKVVLPSDITKAEVEPTVLNFVAEMTQTDPDIDEIAATFYGRKELLEGEYDIAMAVWGPKGRLDHIAPQDAISNRHDEHETKIHIHQNFEENLRRSNEFDFGNEAEPTEEDKAEAKRILEQLEKPKK